MKLNLTDVSCIEPMQLVPVKIGDGEREVIVLVPIVKIDALATIMNGDPVKIGAEIVNDSDEALGVMNSLFKFHKDKGAK